jgi:hypothetical protein
MGGLALMAAMPSGAAAGDLADLEHDLPDGHPVLD